MAVIMAASLLRGSTVLLMMLLCLLLFASLTVAKQAPTFSSANAKKNAGIELASAQISWLRSKGGSFSSKIAIQPLFESDDDHVPLGLFATGEGFKKGEKIMVIPRKCLMTTGLPRDDDSEDMCDTAWNLADQRYLGKNSDYEPYVSYLFSKDRIPLPSTWSMRGRTLLLQIRGQNLPPEDLTQVSFAQQCGPLTEEDKDDKDILEFAYLTVVSRAWSDKLVPVFDMINHHSGRYANVDSTSVHGPNDIVVHATRDIPPGEQLFLSYMDCIDEKGFELEYVLPQMLRDFGFVDPYPQRWTFPTGTTKTTTTNDEDEQEKSINLVFDIDFVNDETDALFQSGALKTPPEEMKLTWKTGQPTPQQLLVLEKELQRIQQLRSHVMTTIDLLEDPYERAVTLDYYNSLGLALTFATANKTCALPAGSEREGDGEQVCMADLGVAVVDDDEDDDQDEEEKDKQNGQGTETEHKPMYKGNEPDDWMACPDFWRIEDDFDLVESFTSPYQGLDIYHGKVEDDMCLYLEGYLHTCASSRPHYHEVFVHYPARFLDEVKRVLFIGGGDSMVLHEVLKYEDLELVVGLELDQRVARATFNHFGTQPHFDKDDKVHWYFGDAAKSLLVLPSHYYGTFDLVIVDILTEVAQSLEVTYDLKVMDAAMLLMKPGGIIVKNEDQGYVPGTNADYTKYSVDLIYHDVPMYCLQIFVVGSNTIDFLTAQPKDHNVETLYLKGVDEFQSQFDSWYNYGVGEGSSKSKCSKKDEADDDDGEDLSSEERDDQVGVMMILEAEDIAIPLQSAESVKPSISASLSAAGMTEIDSVGFPFSDDGVTGFTLTIVVKGGYLVARCNTELRYCAFDIQLYGGFVEKLDTVKAELVRELQIAKTSSYRFVTVGMIDRSVEEGQKIGPPSAKELCKDDVAGTTTRTEVRKEKGPEDFDAPKSATLHSYNLTSQLNQWQSQKPTGAQAFAQIDLPVFWVGEKVLVEHRDGYLEGTVIKLREDFRYDVKYEQIRRTERNIAEDKIARHPEQFDNKLAFRFLAAFMDGVLESNGHSMEPGSFGYKEISAGDGLIVATHWPGGSFIGTWDGRACASFNLYLSSITVDMAKLFEDGLDDYLALMTLDVFPRGAGNVVSFKEDIEKLGQPVWATEDVIAASG